MFVVLFPKIADMFFCVCGIVCLYGLLFHVSFVYLFKDSY